VTPALLLISFPLIPESLAGHASWKNEANDVLKQSRGAQGYRIEVEVIRLELYASEMREAFSFCGFEKV